jgi:desulfoferrodoxin (superoxide reductase-like protein)
MSIFYENILKKINSYVYLEEEIYEPLIGNLKEQKGTLADLPERAVFPQANYSVGSETNTTYFITRISNIVYSLSFMQSSKAGISDSKSLTFGIIDDKSLKASSFFGKTKMGDYRDTASSVYVGKDKNKEDLWEIILGTFYKYYGKNYKLIYRSSLEVTDFFILSNLDLKNIFKTGVSKTEIKRKIKAMRDAIAEINKKNAEIIDKNKNNKSKEPLKNYRDMLKLIFKNKEIETSNDYYSFEGELDKPVFERHADRILNYLNGLTVEIEKNQEEQISPETISEILGKTELNNFLRTKGYKDIINSIFGIKKINEMIKEDDSDKEKYLNNIKEKIQKEAAMIKTNMGINIFNQNQLTSLIKNIELVLDDETIKDKNQKEEKIKNIVNDFYDQFHGVDYLKNRYVTLRFDMFKNN